MSPDLLQSRAKCNYSSWCKVMLEKKLFALCLSELIKHVGGRKESG